jgi:hypothetical protein
MRYDVREVWDPWQNELFTQQASIESEALELYKNNPETAERFLTKYFNHWGNKVVERAWQLGDELWTKYDEKF